MAQEAADLPPRELERRGREEFRAGRFFEAHERFEDAWRVSTGPEKLRLQGLTQLAAGFHKLLTCGKSGRGPRELLEKAREKLGDEPGLQAAIAQCLEALAAGRVPAPPAL